MVRSHTLIWVDLSNNRSARATSKRTPFFQIPSTCHAGKKQMCCRTWDSAYMCIYIYWLVVWTPLKNMKVSWDDDIPNIWKNKNYGKKMFQTTNQYMSQCAYQESWLMYFWSLRPTKPGWRHVLLNQIVSSHLAYGHGMAIKTYQNMHFLQGHSAARPPNLKYTMENHHF